MLDCAIVEDQTAEVEFKAMLSSFTAQIGEWVVEVPVGRIVSAISDNAPGAKKVSDLFGAMKKRRYQDLTAPEKDALSDEEKENWQAWDGLKCEMHKMALAAQHFVGGCVLSEEDKEAQKNYNPDKAAMVHGSVEYAVQKRLSAFGAMKRFWEHVEGHCAVHGESDSPAYATVGVVPTTIMDPAVAMTPNCFDLSSPPSLWRLAACRYAFNRIQAFQGPTAPKMKRLVGADIMSVSNALFAISKMFSGRGDHSKYFLNEHEMLKQFLEELGAKHKDKIPAFKGSRMYWLLESAVAVLINHEDYLRYLHELRECTKVPNRLVSCAFTVLSNHVDMGGVAARALAFVNVVQVGIFVHKHLASRWYTRQVNDAIIAICQDAATGTGVVAVVNLADRLKTIEPKWAARLNKFAQCTAAQRKRVEEAAVTFADVWPHYSRPGYASMAATLLTHIDRDCMGEEQLKHAFVTSCQLESFFAVIDDVNRASNKIKIAENRGQAMVPSPLSTRPFTPSLI